MILPILSILFFGFYYKKNIKYKSVISPSAVTLSVYLLSSILIFFYLENNKDLNMNGARYLEALLVFLALIFIFIFPFINFREDLISKIVLPNKNYLYIFSVLVCLGSLFSLIYFIPTMIVALSTPDIGAARVSMAVDSQVIVSRTVFNTIAGTVASMYQIPIILFFIYQCLNKKKVLRYLLILSSLCYVINSFSYYGRDGIIFWGISFIGIWGLFNPFLNGRVQRKLLKYIVFCLLCGLGGFMLITFSRFGDNTTKSLISYIAQPIPNFCLAYEANPPIAFGNIFPLFRSFLGYPETADNFQQIYVLEKYGTYANVFGTFLKSFILSFGVLGTFVLGVIFSILFKIFVPKKREINLSSLLIYFLYFQMFSEGVFYFKQYNRVGNLLILVNVFLYILFKYLPVDNENKLVVFKEK